MSCSSINVFFLLIVINFSNVDAQTNPSIQGNCGPDGKCRPDLRLKAEFEQPSILFGSNKDIELNIEVYNNGEDSFYPSLYVIGPADVFYKRFVTLSTTDMIRSGNSNLRQDSGISCTQRRPYTSATTIHCQLSPKLQTYHKIKLQLSFEPSRQFASDVVEFEISVNSSNSEPSKTLYDNVQHKSIPISVQTELVVVGTSRVQTVIFSTSLYESNSTVVDVGRVGPEISHVYEVRCAGPSPIEEMTLDIYWPSYTTQGQLYAYLTAQPEIHILDSSSTIAVCEHSPDVNHLGLLVTTTNVSTSYLTRTYSTSTRRIRNSREDEISNEMVSNVCQDGVTCSRIQCKIQSLAPKQSVLFGIKAIPYVDTFIQTLTADTMTANVTSTMLAHITKLPLNSSVEHLSYKMASVSTIIERTIDTSTSSSLSGLEYITCIIRKWLGY